MHEDVEGARVEALGKRIAEQEPREPQQPLLALLPFLPLLHGPEVVPVPELDEPPFLDRPVRARELVAVLRDEVGQQVVAEAVVVEERVVDVDEEDRRMERGHRRRG